MATDKIKMLRTLSIRQPWPECILKKGKNVENRDWYTDYRGYFAIHASQTWNSDIVDDCYAELGRKFSIDSLPFGAIVGIAKLVDVIDEDEVTRNTRKWFGGEYGFVLSDVIKLKEPVPVKGALSFWKLTGRPLKKVLDQLSHAQKRRIAARPLEKPE